MAEVRDLEGLYGRYIRGYGAFMSLRDEDEDTRTYSVVISDEEQYSIWLADREIPQGWRAVGTTGPKAECLSYIESVWTDMRPLSLRTWLHERDAHEENA